MPTLVCAKKEIELSGECILGRHRASGLQVKDDAASRQHAKVFVADGLWWVEDLGSANGTSLNGTWITTRKRLRNRDQIGIGQHRITFSDDADGASAIVEVSRPPAAHSGVMAPMRPPTSSAWSGARSPDIASMCTSVGECWARSIAPSS